MILKYDEEELLYYFTADQLKRYGAGSIKKLVDELAAYVENIEDFFFQIDALTAGPGNDESLEILCIGAGIARQKSFISKESRYVSAISNILEEDCGPASALEVEKKYCYDKYKVIDTRFSFSHYLNLLRIVFLEDLERDTDKCLSRMGDIVPSLISPIPANVITALNGLWNAYDYDNLQHRWWMKDILNLCKSKFPRRELAYNKYLEKWTDDPDAKDLLTEFTIPDGAVKIQQGKYYFDDDFDIPDEDSTFWVPSTDKGIPISEDPKHITRVNVPASVTKISSAAFGGYPALTAIKVNADNPVFHDEEGVLFEGTILRRFPPGKDMRTYDIPGYVTEIGNEAFCDCCCSSCAEIDIPESVTKIGYRAFFGCSFLTKINIPDSVIEICGGAFSQCFSLTEINIPESIAKIDDDTFYSCSSLAEINLPDSVTEIGDSAFSGCNSLTEIKISEFVVKIGEYAFVACDSLTGINVNADNPVFHDEDGVLFEGTILRRFPPGKDMRTYDIPGFVTEIGDSAFFAVLPSFQSTFPNPSRKSAIVPSVAVSLSEKLSSPTPSLKSV